MSPSALEITAAVLLVVGTLLMVVAGIGIMHAGFVHAGCRRQRRRRRSERLHYCWQRH